ncbi:MAG: tyrosine-type recombinase/integrase [Okeania sp. SIO2D1]|nr:tyrosine-type recombinase/integrase [Okeania sp. SIO2D1]
MRRIICLAKCATRRGSWHGHQSPYCMMKNTPNFSHLYSRDGQIWIDIKRQATGQRIRRSLGLIDIFSNWPEARSLQFQIEADIMMGNFDFSFKKYLPRYQMALQAKKQLELSLPKLWEKYLEFKKKHWSPTTYSNSGLVFSKKFASLQCQDLRSPQKIKTELLDRYGVAVARRSCQQIRAAIRWGVENELLGTEFIDTLRWDAGKDFGFTAKDKTDIRPFTISERNAIIEAFETNLFGKYVSNPHSQYCSAIKFWFLTGCRTGELLGLRWQDVFDDYILFSYTRSGTNTGEILKKGLKQQNFRRFPVNSQLQEVLSAANLSSAKSDYVFLDRRNRPIKLQNLVCCWKRVLEGLELPYRRPYQCRHTFISICLNSGKLSPAEVARLVGTSPAMIYKHYLGVYGDIEVPML